jgi:hypothetical protein
VELPVSGFEVLFRAPDGSDDLAILEAAGGIVERALAVLPRLATISGHAGEGRHWTGLTVTDFEAALLGLRQFLFGDTVACVFRCTSGRCAERIEPEFSIAAFLDAAMPRVPRGVERSPERAGWFRLASNGEGEVWFRLPTVEDQVKVLGQPQARTLLARRCIEAKTRNVRGLARVERAMEAMAPPVSRPVAGSCPECGEWLTMPLHVPRLVMEELRMSAAGVHGEIHAIAQTYHWDEATILAMPQTRRQAYAETIRQRERVA